MSQDLGVVAPSLLVAELGTAQTFLKDPTKTLDRKDKRAYCYLHSPGEPGSALEAAWREGPANQKAS